MLAMCFFPKAFVEEHASEDVLSVNLSFHKRYAKESESGLALPLICYFLIGL